MNIPKDKINFNLSSSESDSDDESNSSFDIHSRPMYSDLHQNKTEKIPLPKKRKLMVEYFGDEREPSASKRKKIYHQSSAKKQSITGDTESLTQHQSKKKSNFEIPDNYHPDFGCKKKTKVKKEIQKHHIEESSEESDYEEQPEQQPKHTEQEEDEDPQTFSLPPHKYRYLSAVLNQNDNVFTAKKGKENIEAFQSGIASVLCNEGYILTHEDDKTFRKGQWFTLLKNILGVKSVKQADGGIRFVAKPKPPSDKRISELIKKLPLDLKKSLSNLFIRLAKKKAIN